jgi:hypothetical protein
MRRTSTLLGHSLEWWRGAMWEMPFTLHFNPITMAIAALSVPALFLIANAPSLRKERDERIFKSGSRDRRSAPENQQ